MKLLAIRLVKLLAIPLGCPKTATKWLVIGYQKAIAKSLVIALPLKEEGTEILALHQFLPHNRGKLGWG
jgi:hypothetical protein